MNLELAQSSSRLGYTSDMHYSPDTWASAIALYETAMMAANRSRATIRLRLHYLRQLSRAYPTTPWLVTTENLVEILARPTWGAEAKRSARATFRGFYRWAHGDGRIPDDPALSLPRVSLPRRVPDPTPERVVWDLVRSPDDRLVFMSMLAAYLGMRVGEIAVVHEDDWDGRRLLVHGKGGKERVLLVSDPLLRMMLNGMRGYAFPNRHTGRPLTAGTVSRLLSAAQPGRWTGHKLRHRAASKAFAGTGDIYAVRDMLGHVKVDTTLLYTLMPDERLDAALEAASGVGVA